MHVLCPRRSEENVGLPENGVTGGYDLACGCHELHLGLLQE